MKRFPTGAATPALLTILAAGAPTMGVACIPSPDVSGLPPYDGGGVAQEDSAFSTGEDAAMDSTIIPQEAGPGEDTGAPDASPGTGTINGIVIDYTEAKGRGVVPNATVSVTVPSNSAATPLTTTADADGLFSITGVPAGVALEISVSKPSDLSVFQPVVYSTSLLVATVDANQTLSIFPILHEGCFQIASVLDGGAAGQVTLQNATCPAADDGSPTGAYAAMTFGPTSFVDSQNIPWSGDIRIEMIPLAYPISETADLSWALGLPTGTNGAGTPSGLLGAAEYRVYTSDLGQSDDGEPLFLSTSASASPVSIAVPLYTAPTATTPLAYSFDTTTGAWSSESATPGAVQTFQTEGGPSVSYEMITVPHLTWWAVTNGVTATTCVTGTLQGTSGNVFVRAAGGSYLGTAAAVTDTTGTFCLDVNAATSAGPATSIQLYAGAMEGPVPYGVPAPSSYPVTNLGGGTCASGSGCEALGAITLAPLLTCVSGTVSFQGSEAPADAGTLSAFEDSFDDISNEDEQAGIQQTAYLGQVTVGSDGSFCALGVPTGSVYLVDENGANCQPTNGVPVTSGSNAPVCSAGGCVDAGALDISCLAP
jgi:hypothetical protein